MLRSNGCRRRCATPVDAHRAGSRGYSIVELIVAMGIAVPVVGSAYALVFGWQKGVTTESDRADVQQRLRVAVDALSSAVTQAGIATMDERGTGAPQLPAAAVLPYRADAAAPDPPGTFRTDAISVLAERPRAARTTLRAPLPARSGDALIAIGPGCAAMDDDCGFQAGTEIVVLDQTGAYDRFRVVAVGAGALNVQHTMIDSDHVFPVGSQVIEVESRTFWMKTDTTGVSQLVRSDGAGGAVPLVDHLAALGFEYFGEPSPPAVVNADGDPARVSATYGPGPLPLDVRIDGYGAGENCVFAVDAATSRHVPRLVRLGDGPALVKLSSAELADGPWCPDAASPNRYDADLLRIRRIAVSLRVEAALSAGRGPAGLLFARGGTSGAPSRPVADQEIRFDLAPRNMNLGR